MSDSGVLSLVQEQVGIKMLKYGNPEPLFLCTTLVTVNASKSLSFSIVVWGEKYGRWKAKEVSELTDSVLWQAWTGWAEGEMTPLSGGLPGFRFIWRIIQFRVKLS